MYVYVYVIKRVWVDKIIKFRNNFYWKYYKMCVVVYVFNGIINDICGRRIVIDLKVIWDIM